MVKAIISRGIEFA